MQAFLAHVGHPGNLDIDYTVTRRLSLAEIRQALPTKARADFFS